MSWAGTEATPGSSDRDLTPMKVTLVMSECELNEGNWNP